MSKTPWVLKYTPQTIDDLILSESNKKHFQNLKEMSSNLLFIGRSGLGKTTLAKILAQKFAPNSFLYINFSETSGIDVVRNEISRFTESVSLDGNQKIVILDECDGSSAAAQQALRGVMEEYLEDTKFILTANFEHKLIEPLQSRCQRFTFEVSKIEIVKRLFYILAQEKIVLATEDKKNIASLVHSFYPDVRKTINELQKCCQNGKMEFLNTKDESFLTEFFGMMESKKPSFEVRQFLLSNLSKFNNDWQYLMKHLFDYYCSKKNAGAVLLIADAMHKHAIVFDPEINFTALLINLLK